MLTRNSDIDETFVAFKMVGPVRDRLFLPEVVNIHLLWISLPSPVSPWILEVSHFLLLLGVHRNDGVISAHKALDLVVDVTKLRVALVGRLTLVILEVRLKRVTEFVKPPLDGHVAGRMPLAHQVLCNRSRRFVRPTQKSHWVPGGILFHDFLKRFGQTRVRLLQRFPSASGLADTLLGWEIALLEFPDSPKNSAPGNSRKPCHGLDPASPEGNGLPRHVPASLGFVQPSENSEKELVGHVHILDIGPNIPGTLEENGTLI